MLKSAYLYQEEIKQLFAKTCDNPKYKYYHLGYFDFPKIEDNEWNKIQRVSIYEDKVIGYLSSSVNRTNNIIDSICLLSDTSGIKNIKQFEKDIFDFFLILLRQYPTIQWVVVVNNPVKKKYEKFVNYVGGNIVGIHHKSAKVDNELLDEELFEIISSKEVINKIKELKQRINNE